jgi:hypothetical protein
MALAQPARSAIIRVATALARIADILPVKIVRLLSAIPDLGLSPESRPSDRSAWRDLVKFREGWIAGVATYQAEPYPRPVETRVEHDGAWRDLRVGRKAYWAIEGARRERLRYTQLHHHQGHDRNHD